MLTSTKTDKVTPKQPKFPCLMQDPTSGTVLLMTGNGMGMVVHGNGEDYYRVVGNYTDGWVMSYLKPYEGKITLENK